MFCLSCQTSRRLQVYAKIELQFARKSIQQARIKSQYKLANTHKHSLRESHVQLILAIAGGVIYHSIRQVM